MTHRLTPWQELIRTGIPALKVARRALLIGEVTVPVGQTLDPELLPEQIRARRLRQFYEQRLLEPVDAVLASDQMRRERFDRMYGGNEVIAPVTPVASKIVAGDLPTIPVPVGDEPEPPKRKPPGKGAK